MSLEHPTRIKVSHDVPDKLGDLIQRWNDRVTFENPRFSERYYKGEIHFLVCFRYREPGEHVASIQREWGAGFSLENQRLLAAPDVPVAESERSPVHRHIASRHRMGRILSSHRQQKVMLVDDVRLVQTEQDFAPSSAIWFDSLDSFNRVWPESLYYSLRRGFVFLGSREPSGEVSGVVSNREVKLSERPVAICCNKHTVVTDVVERTSQVVQDIPDNSRHVVGNGNHMTEIPTSISRLEVVIGSDWVSIGGRIPTKPLEGS